jgi:outer membrane protein
LPKKRCVFIIILLFFHFSGGAFADEVKDQPTDGGNVEAQPPPLPLYEIGAVGVSGYFPDYPGADQGRVHWLASPSFRYRGRALRADRDDGVRARLFGQQAVGLDLSLSGSFPARSQFNRAREGMPDLQWIGEVGPRIFVRLSDWPNRFRLLFPLRSVLSTDFGGIYFRGAVFAPGILWQRRRIFTDRLQGWLNISAMFASQELHEYFYQVEPEFSRPDRPVFRTRAGYIGTFGGLGLAYEHDNFVYFGFYRPGYLSGSVSEHSPLFRTHVYHAALIGIGYNFYKSKEPMLE